MDTQPRKPSKKSKLTKSALVFSALLGTILILIGLYFDYQKKILSFYITPVVSEKPPDKPHLSKPVSIKIRDADIDITIQEGEIRNGIWEISEDSASYLDTSAKPGGEGNVIIYGHNKKQIFGNLIDRSEKGQIIEVFTEDGKSYSYKIEEVRTVEPTDIDVVSATDYELLTVYTCSGFLNSDRLVLKASPI